MAEHEAEVRAKLVVEEGGAPAALEKVREGFHHLGETAHEVQHDLKDIVKDAVGTAIGLNIFHGVESMREMGHEVVKAAMDMGLQEKGLAGILQMNDRNHESFEQSLKGAHALREELVEMGTTSGVATSAMVDAFGDIAARSKKPREEITELVGAMAIAGKVVPTGMQGLSEGFGNIELGMIRAKNPVVQLITQLHLVDGTAKQVAKTMQKMAPEDAVKLGEEAIRRMADKAKDLPLSFGQTLESMRNIREEIFESAGTPILNAMKGPLTELRDYFVQNREEIEAWAKSAGQHVGQWVKDAAKLFKEGFQFLEAHGDEIANAISTAAETVKKVVEFIVAHKEAIALAFGAKMALGMAGSVASAAGGVASTVGAIGSFLGAAGPSAGMIAGVGGEAEAAGGLAMTLGATNAGFVGFLEVLAPAVTMVAGLGAAAWQGKKLFDELSHDTQATIDAEHNFVDRLGESADYTSGPYQQTLENLREKHEDLAAAALDAAMTLRVIGRENEAIRNKRDTADAAEIGGRASDALTASITGMAKGFLRGDKLSLPDHPVIAFNGGQTFHIKQDFREADPDRVMIAFRRDLAKEAMNRRTARVGTPFGL